MATRINERGDEVVREYQATHRPGLHDSILQLESESQRLRGSGVE